ncbi:MAG: hypothetical protein OXE52_17770 [Chloroflexi bacterium]|nr:hypothetical protein [Chloroflexota bacterium]
MTFIVRPQQEQFLRFTTQRYKQGGRIAYSFIMKLGMLDSNIPTEVSTDKIIGANRRFNPTHARRIAEYMYDISDWVLGAILLGIDPDYVHFEPYRTEQGESSQYLGDVLISLDGGTSSIKILDGQHRRIAIHDVRERLRTEIRATKTKIEENGSYVNQDYGLSNLEEKFSSLNAMAIPVVIYEEADTQKLRRMFADLAQTRNIDAITKTRFDDRDPFNRAATELVELGRSELFANKVEMERSTPLRSSDRLLSLNQLSRILKILNYGYGGRASRDRINEANLNYDSIIDMGIDFADDFLPSARPEYEILHSLELEDGYIAQRRAHTIAYSATALQLFAGCVFAWRELNLPQNQLADFLRKSNFDTTSEDCLFVKAGVMIKDDTSLLSRSQYMKGAIQYIVREAQEQN